MKNWGGGEYSLHIWPKKKTNELTSQSAVDKPGYKSHDLLFDLNSVSTSLMSEDRSAPS